MHSFIYYFFFLHCSFEFSVELLDLMDDVLNLQAVVFRQLDRCHDNSMTATGQCKLYPLILAIQDSCQLYDCLVKMLFKLHKGSDLTGFRLVTSTCWIVRFPHHKKSDM